MSAERKIRQKASQEKVARLTARNARIAHWFVHQRYLPAVGPGLSGEPVDDPADLHEAARRAGFRIPASALPLWFPQSVLKSFARLGARTWSVRYNAPGVYPALKRLEMQVGDWEKAKRLALGVGLRLAVAKRTVRRRVRLGARWVKQDGERVSVRIAQLPALTDAFRHLLTEAVKGTEAWLLDQPYRAGESADALDEALPLSPAIPAPGTGVETLETTESAADAWTALLRGGAPWTREVLEAATGRRREILEAVLGHLDVLDLEAAFGGDTYRQVAEAKKLAALELDITVNAIDQHFLRLREAV